MLISIMRSHTNINIPKGKSQNIEQNIVNHQMYNVFDIITIQVRLLKPDYQSGGYDPHGPTNVNQY